MDKEKDMKKIVAVIIVLIIALGLFVCVRGCSKDEEEKPTPSPTPVVTPTPTPTPTPDEKDDDQDDKEITTPTENQVVDKVEVKPISIQYASKQQLDELAELIYEAMSFTGEIVGGNDDHLAELVNHLNQLCKQAETLVEKGKVSSKEFDSIYDQLDQAYIELADYVMDLYYQVLDALDEIDNNFTKENIEKLKELVKKLPDNSEKEELVNVVHVLEFQEELMDTAKETIELKYDLKLYDTILLQIEELGRDIVIDGKGHTITVDSDTAPVGISIEANQASGTPVVSQNVTIKNMIIDMKNTNTNAGVLSLADEGFGDAPVYGIAVINSSDVTIENVTVVNAEVGIVLDSSQVTLNGELTLSSNLYAGIEVFGTSENPSTLIISNDATLVNETETHDCPTILVGLSDGTVSNQNSNLTLYTSNEESSVNYYLVEENKEVSTVSE